MITVRTVTHWFAHRRPGKRADACFRVALLGMALGPAVAGGARGEIAPARPLEVRILYDNSGSMYPGYAPPGRHGTPKSVSGARSYREYPAFQDWLTEFAHRQTIVNAANVSLWSLTSNGGFIPNDLQEIQPRVAPQNFDAARLRFPACGQTTCGQATPLSEGLNALTRNFEGLVWLITDNIVETDHGKPDQDVVRFYEGLRDGKRYRSVHLFKYPFHDPQSRQSSALAVYGILVSDHDLPKETIAHFDRKLRDGLGMAKRQKGPAPGDLFPGHEHLQLKDLSIDALVLEARPLQVVLEDGNGEAATENRTVRLALHGQIHSNLTHYAVTAGHYSLSMIAPFSPDPWARETLGAEDIPPEAFEPVNGAVTEPIPPNGSRAIEAELASRVPLSLSTHSLSAWFKAALNPARVEYRGRARMTFEGVETHLDRTKIDVFGIDQAERIFKLQEVGRIHVLPSETSLSFALETSYSRSLLLLAPAAILVAAFWWMLLSRRYRIRISGSPESVVSLRPLSGHEVLLTGQRLGRLSRGLAGHSFAPTVGSAAVSVIPGRESGTYEARFRDGGTFQLTIEPVVPEKPVPTTRPGRPRPGTPSPPPTPTLTAGAPRPRPTIRRPS